MKYQEFTKHVIALCLLFLSFSVLAAEPLQKVEVTAISASDGRAVLTISDKINVLQKGEELIIDDRRYVLKELTHGRMLFDEYVDGVLTSYVWLDATSGKVSRIEFSE